MNQDVGNIIMGTSREGRHFGQEVRQPGRAGGKENTARFNGPRHGMGARDFVVFGFDYANRKPRVPFKLLNQGLARRFVFDIN